MSEQLKIIKSLAAKAQTAHVFELKPVVLALIAAIIEWMHLQEEEKNKQISDLGNILDIEWMEGKKNGKS